VLEWNGIEGAEEGVTSLSVADGVYVMLAPLSVGTHEIHFEATVKFTEDSDGFDFVFIQDVTYNITVRP
jgi:hypothetical protein